MDDALRNGLWNAVYLRCLRDLTSGGLGRFLAGCWHHFLKLTLDHLDGLRRSSTDFDYAQNFLREKFYSYEWHEVYDFLEFVAQWLPGSLAEPFRRMANEVLERENSAYRFVGNRIAAITSERELEAIEEAIAASSPFTGVQTHLNLALAHLSDRKNPDYRNSIKESISAVEGLSRLLTGKKKATLGDALNEMDKRVNIHGALRQALTKLYAYTSDSHGIRHALMDEQNLTFVDAKFMLVACAGFVSYLVGKAAEAGITLAQP